MSKYHPPNLFPRARILRMSDLLEMLGISESSVRRLMKKGGFPSSVRVSENIVGWLESEVEDWILDLRPEGSPADIEDQDGGGRCG